MASVCRCEPLAPQRPGGMGAKEALVVPDAHGRCPNSAAVATNSTKSTTTAHSLSSSQSPPNTSRAHYGQQQEVSLGFPLLRNRRPAGLSSNPI
uniref:Uncharacterized protein n=1 Tax=Plectus sambesii TaxID=2011161 RepID=A0A914W920_9BILA